MNQSVLAERMSRLGTESAFEVLNRAKKLEAKGINVIHLEIGQPDFITPQNIINAACESMKSGNTGYTPSQGAVEVRETIAQYCKKYKNIDTNADEVVIVPGGKPIMFYTMLALINPGDEVIYPNPGFPIYESCINFAGGVPVPMPILQENDFKVDINKLKELVTDKTKLIIINSPANPTGGVLEEKDIRAIADVVRGTNAYVMSDEIYDRLVYQGAKPFSIASIPDMKDRTIVLDGLSKSYAMTGWRIGYGVCSKEIAAAIALLMVNSNSCAASFTQQAVIEALTGPQEAVENMRKEYEKRLEFMVSELNKIDGLKCLMPKGSFYAFPNIKGTGISDKDFADRLLNEAGVASLSGSGFGKYGEGHLRFSAANSMENLQEAVKRIRKFVESI